MAFVGRRFIGDPLSFMPSALASVGDFLSRKRALVWPMATFCKYYSVLKGPKRCFLVFFLLFMETVHNRWRAGFPFRFVNECSKPTVNSHCKAVEKMDFFAIRYFYVCLLLVEMQLPRIHR